MVIVHMPIEYPTPIPPENQVGWPLYKTTVFILLLFLLMLHHWLPIGWKDLKSHPENEPNIRFHVTHVHSCHGPWSLKCLKPASVEWVFLSARKKRAAKGAWKSLKRQSRGATGLTCKMGPRFSHSFLKGVTADGDQKSGVANQLRMVVCPHDL